MMAGMSTKRDMELAAETTRLMFVAYVNAGFTEEQAMRLMLVTLSHANG
jgi:hypothetical protein